MSSDAFRDAIGNRLALCTGDNGFTGDEANAVLSMPEMEAIRAALLTAIDESPLGCPYLLQNGAEGAYGPNTCNRGCRDEPECVTFGYPRLPESVIDWVLGGPS